MKPLSKILTLSIFWIIIQPVLAQDAAISVCPQGTVIESQSFHSGILGRDVKYTIYLPPDYSTSQRSYPVVYLLHGYTDDETGWIQFGEANLIADRAIADGSVPSMIIVMPDAGVTWYINDYQGKTRYEDMFIQEFIPFIDNNYRTRPKKEFRGVAGLSMGGYGTLIYALKHPEMFAACVAFSSAVRTEEQAIAMPQDQYDQRYAELFGPGLKGKDRLTEHWKNNSILYLARTLPEESLKSIRIYIDCGDDDFLTIGNAQLHIILTERGIPHEYRSRDGKHSWSYWRTGLPIGLQFIGESFHR